MNRASRASVTCGVYLRPSGSSPTRCISRSCSACNSIRPATARPTPRWRAACGRRTTTSRRAAIRTAARLTRPSIETISCARRDVDIADEAQGEVIIFRIDPARARQAAAQQRQRLARRSSGISRPVKRRGIETSIVNRDTYERGNAAHSQKRDSAASPQGPQEPRLARTRAISSSTFGRIACNDCDHARRIRMNRRRAARISPARQRLRERTDRTRCRISCARSGKIASKSRR